MSDYTVELEGSTETTIDGVVRKIQQWTIQTQEGDGPEDVGSFDFRTLNDQINGGDFVAFFDGDGDMTGLIVGEPNVILTTVY